MGSPRKIAARALRCEKLERCAAVRNPHNETYQNKMAQNAQGDGLRRRVQGVRVLGVCERVGHLERAPGPRVWRRRVRLHENYLRPEQGEMPNRNSNREEAPPTPLSPHFFLYRESERERDIWHTNRHKNPSFPLRVCPSAPLTHDPPPPHLSRFRWAVGFTWGRCWGPTAPSSF